MKYGIRPIITQEMLDNHEWDIIINGFTKALKALQAKEKREKLEFNMNTLKIQKYEGGIDDNISSYYAISIEGQKAL